MSEIPLGWALVSLSEVTTPRGEKATPSDLGELPFIGLEEVEAHTGRVICVQTTRGLKSAVALFAKGDLLYGRLRPYLNKVVLAEDDGAASAEFIVFPPSGALNQSYLQRMLMSPDFVQFTGLRSTGDRPRVSFESISDYQFPLPPLPEQHRIVVKIDSLTAKARRAREHLDHLPRLVEKYKQAVLDMVFAGLPDRAPLRDLVDPERGIPYGIVQTGKPYEGGIPTIRCGDIKAFRVLRRGLKRVDPAIAGAFSRTRLRGGEVLIAIRGSVGETCVVPADLIDCNISREVAMIPVQQSVSPEFIMFFLATSEAKRFILGNVKGVAQQGINLRDLKELLAPTGTLEEQLGVVRRIRNAFAWIDRLGNEATSARKLIDRLDQAVLAKAFRGELVSQDPADEHASVLLERIRSERGAAPKARRGRKAKTDA